MTLDRNRKHSAVILRGKEKSPKRVRTMRKKEKIKGSEGESEPKEKAGESEWVLYEEGSEKNAVLSNQSEEREDSSSSKLRHIIDLRSTQLSKTASATTKIKTSQVVTLFFLRNFERLKFRESSHELELYFFGWCHARRHATTCAPNSYNSSLSLSHID